MLWVAPGPRYFGWQSWCCGCWSQGHTTDLVPAHSGRGVHNTEHNTHTTLTTHVHGMAQISILNLSCGNLGAEWLSNLLKVHRQEQSIKDPTWMPHLQATPCSPRVHGLDLHLLSLFPLFHLHVFPAPGSCGMMESSNIWDRNLLRDHLVLISHCTDEETGPATYLSPCP